MTKVETYFLAALAALFFVWPIAHTVTLRDLLLVGTLLVGVSWYGRLGRIDVQWADVRHLCFSIAAFVVWMLFVAVAVSPESLWSLDEIRGQWLRALAALVVGVVAAAGLSKTPARRQALMYVIMVPLFVHVSAIDLCALYEGITTGAITTRASGMTQEVDKANYLTNMLLALLMAEGLTRLVKGRGFVPKGPWLGLALGIVLFSLYAERARNGVVVVAVLLVCAIGLLLFEFRHKLSSNWSRVVSAVGAGALVLSVLAMGLSAKAEFPMDRVLASVSVALDTSSHKGWLNESKYGLPTLPDGAPIDPSAYVRVAWYKEGLRLAWLQPLGIGFGRNAFGHAMAANYGVVKGHSHSSFIDLTVGVGIPGIVLWLAFLGGLVRVGLKRFHETRGVYGLALALVTVDFGTRMFIDSNVRDHMLQMFMFVVGVLTVFALSYPGSETVRRSARS